MDTQLEVIDRGRWHGGGGAGGVIADIARSNIFQKFQEEVSYCMSDTVVLKKNQSSF